MKRTGKTGKAEQTRRFIIEKAAPIFNKKGYAGTSLSDLTQATGLTKGGIYGNFKNKDELAVCAFDHNAGFIIHFFSREVDNADTCIDKLLAFPGAFRKLYKAMLSHGGCPILNTAAEADDTHTLLRERVVEVLEGWKKNVIRITEAGIRKGEIKPDTDARAFAEVMISLLEGGGILAKVSGKESYILNAIGHVEEMVRGLEV